MTMTETPAPTDTPAPAPAAMPDAAPVASSGDFTPAQLKVMADELVAQGTITREAADAMLAADGVQVEQPKPEDELSPEAASIDALFPAAKPEEYQMPYMGDTDPAQQVKLAADARGWLAEARFPAGIGSALLSEVDKVSTAWAKMGDTERQLYVRHEVATLQRLWGGEYESKVSAAKQLIRELESKRPGLARILEESGAGNSAAVIVQVALHAERLLARRPRPKA